VADIWAPVAAGEPPRSPIELMQDRDLAVRSHAPFFHGNFTKSSLIYENFGGVSKKPTTKRTTFAFSILGLLGAKKGGIRKNNFFYFPYGRVELDFQVQVVIPFLTPGGGSSMERADIAIPKNLYIKIQFGFS
jgi:hypothetical protein